MCDFGIIKLANKGLKIKLIILPIDGADAFTQIFKKLRDTTHIFIDSN